MLCPPDPRALQSGAKRFLPAMLSMAQKSCLAAFVLEPNTFLQALLGISLRPPPGCPLDCPLDCPHGCSGATTRGLDRRHRLPRRCSHHRHPIDVAAFAAFRV